MQAIQSNQSEKVSPYPVSFDEETIDLGEYLGVLLTYKWFIASVALVGTLLGGGYAFIATPVYQANALIQVEDPQASGLAALEDVAGFLEGDAAVEAEVQLLRSRMVIGEAVNQLSRNIIAEPEYFPVIGKAVARYFSPNQPGVAKAWLNQSQYAWGGELIRLDLLEVPSFLLGEKLRLVAGKAGHYRLFDQKNQPLLEGEVGKLAEISTVGGERIKLFVSSLTARPGTYFRLTRLSPIASIEKVLADLSVKEQGKKSGMLGLTMTGPSREDITTLLNKIADVYVTQNVDRSSAEAGLSLSFIEKQLPPLKERVDAAENAYNQYRTQHSSVDLEAETKSVLEGLVNIETALLELQQERDELRKRFKPAHPVIEALDGKIGLLKSRGSELETDVDRLPDTQRDILRLARDVEVNTGLYTKLLSISQELRVVKAGTVGNVRVVDYALLPEQPIKPRKFMLLAISLLASLLLGAILAFLLRALKGGVNDPDEIERKLGVPVYASIMHSKHQRKMINRAKKESKALAILAQQLPDDPAVESFRSLRTTLHFSLKQADNNIIMIAGSSPKIGKSFTAINLAAVMASNDKKVLIIDADLRRGYLHRYNGQKRDKGLVELITDPDESVADYIQSTEVEGLYMLPTGKLPPNPAELLLHEFFKKKLDVLSGLFDYVVIDGPPILAVTDAAIIGRNVATTLLVAKADFHPMRELEQATRQLQQAGVVIKGVIFNDVEVNSGRYGSGRYVYQYSYKAS
ncbi:polysaccharide biosynthesis tyrosine autokinase [Motiliproteus sp. MSK22-1]|uniref:polysaccharide biosynthesis tyrosine autokinase n=1 Tax=Motiliproteus sp. MSK22-1 TaxID=1897630 RepID=UPI0013014E6D|nr:polysaccharide biosynthesis tyrosine autokinase [Motiliproteus sp. MSK22-1]